VNGLSWGAASSHQARQIKLLLINALLPRTCTKIRTKIIAVHRDGAAQTQPMRNRFFKSFHC